MKKVVYLEELISQLLLKTKCAIQGTNSHF